METDMPRRNFLKSGVTAGAAGLVLGQQAARSDVDTGASDDLNVALIGGGDQGRVLVNACLKIPGIRFKAVVDIWSENQRYVSRYLSKFGHTVKVYDDHLAMLDAEKDIDAVLVASPDFVHAPHTISSLKAGKHVYCEKMMSNSIEAARDMVKASRETGKLLQIGHQRRSNPRYRHVFDNLLKGDEVFGPLTHANAQWNRGRTDGRTWREAATIDEATLNKYGYSSMSEFRNWRWFKKYGGGPMSDLGAHQIDIFNWFFGGPPSSVIASGGRDHYPDFEHLDNVLSIYEYPCKTAKHTIRAFYQVLTTSSSLGFLERFMGVNGTLAISENPRWNECYREAYAPDWQPYTDKGFLKKEGAPDGAKKEEVVVDARETAALDAWQLPVTLDKYIHQPHLENFFDAIRKGTPLNCPGETGFECTVAVIKVAEAVASGKRLEFKPEDFIA